MNTNLLVRKSVFLNSIKRTHVQLSAVFLFCLITIGHQAFAADDQVTLIITDPHAVCSPSTVDLTLPEVTAGSTPGLVFTYFIDFGMTIPIPDPTKVGASGTYYIVGRRPIPPGIAVLPVHVLVDPASAGGAVAGSSFFCNGSTSGILTLSGHVGVVEKWQSSVSPFNVWTDIPNTFNTYTSGPLSQTTQFRAVVQSGTCGQANSSPATTTIFPTTVGGTVTGGGSVCSGTTSGLLSLSGSVGTITKWQSSVSPFNVWIDIANTSTTYTSGTLTQTTQFRAVVQSGNCSSENSASATVTVDPVSIGGSVSGGTTICAGTSGDILTLSGYVGTIIKWQSSVAPFNVWTDIVNITPTHNPGILFQTTQFRAVVQSGSCVIANSTVTTVTVSPTTVGGAVSGGSAVCLGSTSGLLTLSGYTGTVVKWQSSVSPFIVWTDIANITNTYTSGFLFQTTQFRAVVQSGSCATANSAATTVTISAATVGGTVLGGTTICFNNPSGVLTLSGHVGSIVKWQSSVSPFTVWTDIVNTNTTYTSGALIQTTQFRAVIQSGTCPAINSASTTVTVTPTVGAPVFALGLTSNRCMGAGSVIYTALATDALGYTYSLDAASLAAGNNIDITTGTVTYAAGWSGTSRITVSATGCNGPTSATHTVTITVPPSATISYGALICSKELTHSVILTGSAGGTFSASPAGLVINPLTGAISPALSTPNTYTVTYAIAASGGCSDYSTTTQVQISRVPQMESIVIKDVTCNGDKNGTITAKALGNEVFTYSWTGPSSFSSNNPSISGLASGAYILRVTNPVGCSIDTTVTVFEPAAMSISFIGTNPTISGAADGKIAANLTGGTVPYSYLWKRIAPSADTTTLVNQIVKLRYGIYNLTVTDKNGCTKDGKFQLYDPPHANDDTISTLENSAVSINVVSNVISYDTDNDGTVVPSTVDLDPLTAGVQTIFVVDKKGVFSVDPSGLVNFRPLPNYYGIVVIQYVVSDNDGLLSNVANITVTVKSTNLPPVAVNDTYTVPEHVQALGNIILNDSDPEGQLLVVSSFRNGSTAYAPNSSMSISNVGTLVINANGTFVFTPLGHFFGVVPPIDYTIVDIEGLTATATLFITVTAVNDPPVAINDNFETKENVKVEGNVLLRNPQDPDSDPKNLSLVTDTIAVRSPLHGTVVLSANGDFTYQPVVDFIGTDSFIYQICNSLTPPLCSIATVTIVIAKNDSCKVFVPNVFTPNGDGIHDYLQIRCLYNYENPEIQVFNRNGNLIFKKDHYGDTDFWGSVDQAFWTGRSQHKWNVGNDELPVGTYYYILKLGNGEVLTGYVFLAK
jgi:gliding motility-associated-like protein